MIGIIGNGFVGNAVYQNLRDKVTCKVFDVDKKGSGQLLADLKNVKHTIKVRSLY